MTTIIAENENELIKTLVSLIEEIAIDAIRKNGIFKVGVSGNLHEAVFLFSNIDINGF